MGQSTMGVKKNTKLLKFVFNLVVTFEFGGILRAVHGAHEFLDVDVIKVSPFE